MGLIFSSMSINFSLSLSSSAEFHSHLFHAVILTKPHDCILGAIIDICAFYHLFSIYS
jgi:hypothetical protein